jgi:hypothetical protein
MEPMWHNTCILDFFSNCITSLNLGHIQKMQDERFRLLVLFGLMIYIVVFVG